MQYKNKSSRVATDLLYRLCYLVNQPIENLQTDNGSEFALEFERATTKLSIQRYFSRVRTPKDNSEIERFNQTLEYEWLYNFNLSLDPEELNPRLTEWFIEYNFNRLHQSLGYLAPIEYIEKELAKIHSPVLPKELCYSEIWKTSCHIFCCSASSSLVSGEGEDGKAGKRTKEP